jgi:TRAP-type uncharacterized transport system substrate-binding protein
MPDTVAYEITRAVFDHFDDFQRLHPAFESLPIAEMVPTTGRAPIHAGAERYYREQGWAAVIRRHLSVIGLLFPR